MKPTDKQVISVVKEAIAKLERETSTTISMSYRINLIKEVPPPKVVSKPFKAKFDTPEFWKKCLK